VPVPVVPPAAVVAAGTVVVVRFPRSWGRGVFHPQASRGPDKLAYLPGWRGTGQQPMAAIPVTAYTGRITGVPLTGGQALAAVPVSGTVKVQVGPQGLGNVWYPAQVNASTTTGLTATGDNSVCNVYLGPLVAPTTLVGTIYNGAGTAALAIPSMSPGQTLIAVWTGANSGDTAALNVTGTMDALSTS
jgi:hypothetical protein